MKNYIKTIGVAIFLAFVVLVSAPSAEAATTYQSTAAVQARLSALVVELQALQAQLAALQGVSTPTYGTQCYRDTYGNQYCTQPSTPIYTGTNILRNVEVDFDNDFARIEIEYTSGRNREFVLGGLDDQDEVIEFIMDETNATRNQILAVIDWSGDLDDNDDSDADDIDSIDVDINNGDADVRVEYEDGDTDRFTIDNETNHNDIIEEIADELDIDEDDVEDLVDFDNDNNDEDVDRIVVTIDESDDDSVAKVYYEDNDTETFDYDEDDEDDIIDELADDLDMDEDDVEDVTDFRYVN